MKSVVENIIKSQPLRIHQFHYSAAGADAVTNQMFFIQQALQEVGISGEIFASHIRNLPKEKVQLFQGKKLWDCDLLLVHHSHGNPELKRLSRIEVPKALVYHNITPAHFFRHDPIISDLCELGRRQLHALKSEVIATFADSEYNAQELTDLKFPDPTLLPLFDLSESLKEVKDTEPPASRTEPKTILFVGRITAHKNQALLIHSFYHLKKLLPKGSKLFLVGSQDPIYTDYLKLLTSQLKLNQDVQFTGSVTQKSLENFYQLADAFVCLSLHEGYCIPLVEAMSRHVPIIALPTTGIKGTLGPAGVHLGTQDPIAIAEVIATLLNQPQVLKTVLQGQHQRILELAKVQTKQRVQELMLNLCDRIRTKSEVHYEKPSLLNL